MQPDYEPFDLKRMFIGDFDSLLLLEIVVRTGFMYLVALLLIRFIGKRGLGQMSPFEYIIVIALGSATGDPMFYPEVPLIHGVIVLTMIVGLQKILISLTKRSITIARFVESTPTMLIQAGAVDAEMLKQEGIAKEELYMRLREAGITNVGQVRFAYLEPSGNVSVFAYEEPQRPGDTTLA
jgi:uncharacterized membrane protein YcaP (DUF421 family)